MGVPIKIGSFNMYKFSYRSDKEIKKNIKTIVDIIEKENFDILAMQEVFSADAIENLLMPQLGKKAWDSCWDQPKSNSIQANEGYAFLWKKNKFRLATDMGKGADPTFAKPKDFMPRIYHQYRKDPLLIGGRLARDPFYIRLESINGWYEIRLINTHIMFSARKGSEEILDSRVSDISEAEKRRREFEALVNIYCKLEDKRYRSNRPAYTFLLGDYNLNLNRPWTSSPYLNELIEKDGKQIITVQDQLTTLKRPSHKEPDKPVCEFSRNYDHATFNRLRFNGMQLPVPSCIDTVKKYCSGDFELHRKEVSDHIPICLSFSL